MIREYRVGRFTLEPFRQLLSGGTPVSVGRKALELLSVLAKAEGRLVTKDELMAAVWPNTVVEDNALQVHIASLRKLLCSDADLLSTCHGIGYRLMATAIAARPVSQMRMQSISEKAILRLVELTQSSDEMIALLASRALLLGSYGEFWEPIGPSPYHGHPKIGVKN
jgi:DNA-binding winged helix-turn-helix (wHTH) protein